MDLLLAAGDTAGQAILGLGVGAASVLATFALGGANHLFMREILESRQG
jgi:hypothetical protein